MPSVRSTRKSSRVSSPLVRSAHDSPAPRNEPKKEKGQMSLKSFWVEPPVKEPAPSFEEHGFERGGVVKDMVPLGQRPTQRDLQQRLRATSSRRSYFNVNGAVSGEEDGHETPEMTPAVEHVRLESEKPEELPLPPIINRDEVEDDDYRPKGSKLTPRRSKSAGKAATPSVIPTRETEAHNTPKSRTPMTRRRLENGAHKAIEMAQHQGLLSTGMAIKQLLEESLHDHNAADLLEAIVLQRHTPQQDSEFHDYIKRAKKELRASEGAERNAKRPRRSLTTGAKRSHSPSDSPITAATSTAARSRGAKPAPSPSPQLTDTQPSSVPNSPPKASLNGTSTPQLSVPPPSSPHPSQTATPNIIDSDSELSDVNEAILERPPPDVLESNGNNIAESSSSGEMTRSKAKGKGKAKTAAPKASRGPQSTLLTDTNKRPIQIASPDELEELTRKKQKLTREFPDCHAEHSNIRVESGRQTPAAPTGTTRLRLINNAVRPAEKATSPDPSRASSITASRPTTPVLAPKRSKAARIKVSPAKRRRNSRDLGAGNAHPGGGMESPVGNEGRARSVSDDYCCACGAGGSLLCCDGCEKVSHFQCCDPPMDQEDPAVENGWRCYECQPKDDYLEKPSGLFGALLDSLKGRNPVQFKLPEHIRTYFEGVRTGETGEYIEEKKWVSKSAGKVLDTLKLRDAKDNPILCCQCGKSALSGRQIIKCDSCDFYWHLDCVDPPMANKPFTGYENGLRAAWTCPRHTDGDLKHLGLSGRRIRVPRDRSALIGRAEPINGEINGESDAHPRDIHKLRIAKRRKVVSPVFSRGLRNSGVIEVEDDPDVDDEGFMPEEQLESGSEDEMTDANGEAIVYRLPAQGIKLDFIEKVKQANIQKAQAEQASAIQASMRQAALQATFNNHNLIDQKTALNLVQLAQKESDITIGQDRLATLLQALTAETPEDIVKESAGGSMSATSTQPTGSDEVAELLQMQKLISRRLEMLSKSK